ncbi:MAG: DUF1188 domain-containing protein [Methanobrevibacter sp.]|nr:DUF1188 domain-containing protein [Candidatus Methanovirga procula]
MKNKVFQQMNCEKGITSHVLTLKSNLKVRDVLSLIINKKSSAILQWIDKLNNAHLDNIVIVGSYLTGLGIAKLLKPKYENVTIVDIYSHLQELVDKFSINESVTGDDNINFSSNIDLIKTADCVVDTTGLGGISIEQTKSISPKIFIIEDPIAEENDNLLSEKNNIHSRFDAAKAQHKAILKTKGLNTKTSGTMTFTVNVLLESVNYALKKSGVLYAVTDLTFFEGLIFKEKDIPKFLDIINSPAITISTLTSYDLDEIIEGFLDKINSTMIN